LSVTPAIRARLNPSTSHAEGHHVDAELLPVEAAIDLAASLAMHGLGDIDLPPAVGSTSDRAHLNSAAQMYLASELENAGLVPSVEALAGIFVSGGIPADFGPAGRTLMEFWENRHSRLSAAERQAFFAHLFGETDGPSMGVPDGGRNTGFDPAMTDFCAAIYKYDGGPAGDAAIETTGASLADNLSQRSGGMVAAAAHDLISTLQEALTIVKAPAVQRAVGAQSVWAAVQRIESFYLHETLDVEAHVTRGRAGMQVLSWLAEQVVRFGAGGGPIPGGTDGVVAWAEEWLQSSLGLEEQRTSRSSGGG
jgi:hypothetical protein